MRQVEQRASLTVGSTREINPKPCFYVNDEPLTSARGGEGFFSAEQTVQPSRLTSAQISEVAHVTESVDLRSDTNYQIRDSLILFKYPIGAFRGGDPSFKCSPLNRREFKRIRYLALRVECV